MSVADLPLFAHRPQDVHANSVKALREEHPKLSKRAAAILENVRQYGPATDRQIMQRMDFFDMNAVRPRISELIESHHLREIENVICGVTRKRVRKVGI